MTDRTVYLDHAATTPMVPAAVEAMTAHLLEVGNPSSLHASGRHARRVVEESRETIAQALDCRPGEVVFTSGGTEADNIALKGVYWSRRLGDPRRTRILTTAVEHHAVLDPLHWLEDAEG
ncbi:aminotransferase class V-fold PLP-dependent enzyme, partial [Nocardioides hankookensis]